MKVNHFWLSFNQITRHRLICLRSHFRFYIVRILNSLNSVLQIPAADPPPSTTHAPTPPVSGSLGLRGMRPTLSPRRPPFGGWGMPGVLLFRLVSQCKQAFTFFLVNWSWPHRRRASPPHLPVHPPLPHPSPRYCQSTPNTTSTADWNHVEELLVPTVLI